MPVDALAEVAVRFGLGSDPATRVRAWPALLSLGDGDVTSVEVFEARACQVSAKEASQVGLALFTPRLFCSQSTNR
jgi:hypothetical protein